MSYTLHTGDALTVLRSLPEASVHCCAIGIELNPEYAQMARARVDAAIAERQEVSA